jgi:hypothetical protein
MTARWVRRERLGLTMAPVAASTRGVAADLPAIGPGPLV